VLSKPASAAPSEAWFEPEYWLKQQRAMQVAGGRSSVWFIRADHASTSDHESTSSNWVLRHYRRGGLIAKLLSDQYLWLGAAATRSFREWRLLHFLRSRHLPVPIPIAARYVRRGLSYRADLITEEIAHTRSLAQRLTEARLSPELWQRVGFTLARFHAIGVYHADLNANNILLDNSDEVHVLDFDRGRVREPKSAWIQGVLARLLRSLTKLQVQRGSHFDANDWQVLLSAHHSELARLRTQAGQERL
jgi:3-deoxy-D-manno-octulosonic acid kinase